MAKNITFTYEGKDYNLEFSRKSIQRMEDAGFSLDTALDKPITLTRSLFAGSFLKNHKFVKNQVVDEIFKLMPNKEMLLEKLIEMYHDTLESLYDEPEDSEKNVQWGANW